MLISAGADGKLGSVLGERLPVRFVEEPRSIPLSSRAGGRCRSLNDGASSAVLLPGHLLLSWALGSVSEGVRVPPFPPRLVLRAPPQAPPRERQTRSAASSPAAPTMSPACWTPVHTVSHTVAPLPTFREFTRPEGEWPPQVWSRHGGPGRGQPGDHPCQGSPLAEADSLTCRSSPHADVGLEC